MISRLWTEWRRLLPRCGDTGPWRLDTGPCILPRGHVTRRLVGGPTDWHGDGRGHIWNHATGRWGWRGPRALRNSTEKGDLVFDPFAGSGSTLIACHQEARLARLIEVDPTYADVICKRFQQHTGTAPMRDGLAVSFLQ